MSRISTNYTDLDLSYLEAEDLNVIEIKAKALSLSECLDYLCVDEDHLPEKELNYAKKAWRRGRMSSISTAADKLFTSMDTRNGGSFALEYLRALSSTFHLEPTDPGQGSINGNGFSFNVIMPEDKKDKAQPKAEVKAIK